MEIASNIAVQIIAFAPSPNSLLLVALGAIGVHVFKGLARSK